MALQGLKDLLSHNSDNEDIKNALKSNKYSAEPADDLKVELLKALFSKVSAIDIICYTKKNLQ